MDTVDYSVYQQTDNSTIYTFWGPYFCVLRTAIAVNLTVVFEVFKEVPLQHKQELAFVVKDTKAGFFVEITNTMGCKALKPVLEQLANYERPLEGQQKNTIQVKKSTSPTPFRASKVISALSLC